MKPHNLSRRAILTKAAAFGTMASMPVQAKSPEGGADAELLKLTAQALAAWDAYGACAEEWCHVINIPDHVDAKQSRLADIADNLRSEAFAIPARTREGFRAKARLVMTTLETRQDGSMPPDRDGYPVWLLCQDLLAEAV